MLVTHCMKCGAELKKPVVRKPFTDWVLCQGPCPKRP